MNHRAGLPALGVLVASLTFLAPAAFSQPAPKWPSSSAPRPLSAREVKFPAYELRSLSNGLQVVVVMHHEQPAVSLRLIVGAGGAHDPVAKPGLAALLTSVLDQGTTTKTAQQVADTIDFVGGRLETGVGRDLCWANVVVMRDSFMLGMSLLADVVRNPAFAEDEVARQRRQTLSALQVSHHDPEYIANAVFDRLVYGVNPYGLPGNGTADSVERIGRDDLVAFHRTYFAPNNCILAVVGDVTVDDAMTGIEAAFGDWPRRGIPVLTPGDPPMPARRVVVIDKPDAVQTEVRVGHLGVARKTPDFMPIDLAIRVLGGEGANRLHRVLRTERGLTYGVRADAQTLKSSGMIVTRTSTRSEATGDVLRLIADEYWRLRRERVGDEELSEAKAYATGHFPLTIETPDDIATQVLNVLFYELPVAELQTYRQRVNAVSVDDVARVAWKYVKPDRLAVVLVGNAAAFLDRLKGVGFGKYEMVKLSDLDLTTPDFRRADAKRDALPALGTGEHGGSPRVGGPAATDVEPEAMSQQARPDSAEALIARAIEAKGGRSKLESVKTVEAATTTTLMLPQGPVRTETTTYIQYPDRFRVEARVAVGTVVQVYAGQNQVWVQDPVRGSIDVPPQVRKDFKAGVDRDVIPLLLRAAAGDFKLRRLESGTDPGTGAVEVSGGGIEAVTLHIDQQTGLVVRESYRLEGGAGTAEEVFADYRDVDGVKVAFKATVRRNGLPVLERTVTSFKINPTLQPGLFDPPAATKKPPGTDQLAATPTTTVPPPPPPSPSMPSPVPAGAVAASSVPLKSRGAESEPPVSEAEALALVQKAIYASGGLDRLTAVRTLKLTAANTMTTPEGKTRAESLSYLQYPDRFRVEVKQSGGTVVALLVGNDVTLRTRDGAVGPPPPGSEAHRSFKASVQRDPISLLLRIAAGGELRARILPQDAAVQEASRERLVQVTGALFETVILGFDTTTGLLRRLSYAGSASETGPWLDDTFSDYREVSGVKIPFRSETRRDTYLLRERVVKEALVNPPLDPSLFDKKRLK